MHEMDEAAGSDLGIPSEGDGGYLKMAEVSQAPMSNLRLGRSRAPRIRRP